MQISARNDFDWKKIKSKASPWTMSDDFLESLIKIRIKRNDQDQDNFKKHGGFLNPYSVVSPTESSSQEAMSLQVPERVPRLLFLFLFGVKYMLWNPNDKNNEFSTRFIETITINLDLNFLKIQFWHQVLFFQAHKKLECSFPLPTIWPLRSDYEKLCNGDANPRSSQPATHLVRLFLFFRTQGGN